MKKIFLKFAVMAFVTVFILTAVPQVAYAQVSKKNAKQEQKQASKNFKAKVKDLEKDGWKISGDYRTLELAVIELQNQLDENPEIYGFVSGVVNKCRSTDACKQMVQFQAQRELATELNAEIQGTAKQLTDLDLASGDEANNLINAMGRYVKADVSGILTPSFSLIKDNKDGTNSFQTFYLVDLEKKAGVQKSALEKSLKEANLTIERASAIQKFIKEEFDAKNAGE